MISGGGAPTVSLVGHTMTAPLRRTSSNVTHGVRSGVASRNRLGRLGAPSEISAAVRGSPATTASGVPVRFWKLSAKNCAIWRIGLLTLRSTPTQGSANTATTASTGGTSSSPNQAAITMCWWLSSMPLPASSTTARPESTTSGAMPPTGAGQPASTATMVAASAGTIAK